MKNKKDKSKRFIAIIFLCVLINIISFGYSVVHENKCKNRVYTEFEDKENNNVQSANIRIAVVATQTYGNVSDYNFGEIGCGVIFEYKDGFYYALTAAHVVDGKTEFKSLSTDSDEDSPVTREYYMIPYGTLTAKQISAESKCPVRWEYYTDFASVDVVYISEENDLAIVRFQSDENYESLPLADGDPLKGEKIAVFGYDKETGSTVNYGEITSGKYKTFAASDDRPSNRILKHNAYSQKGYSGGAVLNEQMKIVGINIGGAETIWRKFSFSAMVPVNLVKETIEEWEEQTSGLN